MRLSFVSPYLSIKSFPEINVPDFCLITGLNGAGKSHLLKAIAAGAISVQDISQVEIQAFDWNWAIKAESRPLDGETLRNERRNYIAYFKQTRETLFNQFINNNRQLLPGVELADLQSLVSASFEEIQKKYPDPTATEIWRKLTVLDNTLREHLKGRRGHPDAIPYIERVVELIPGRRPCALTDQDFFSVSGSEERTTLFSHSVARIFVAYANARRDNQFNQFLSSKGETAFALSDEEFIQKNGPPPWELVNDCLKAAGMDFEVNCPKPDQTYIPELIKLSTGAQISLSNLSSGEKILMSLALAVYANDYQRLAPPPKLLLLDEADAPLHPSMTRHFIKTIRNILIKQLKIKVILTTHSPSTVAIAEDECIHVMESSILTKASRAKALNLLLEGVPTLALSFEGRRQVFVESSYDAECYSELYKICRTRLQSERSLEFVGTGIRSSEGEERNTGCEVVKTVVQALTDAGNTSVFGLIDWDNGRNEPTDRIVVLVQDYRDGLENLVFDPLAIGLLISKMFQSELYRIGLENINYRKLASLEDNELLQRMVNEVTQKALAATPMTRVKVEYIGGLRLDVDECYLKFDDHGLENKLREAFPFLQKFQRKNSLHMSVIENVFGDVPEAVPSHLFALFSDLLERPAH